MEFPDPTELTEAQKKAVAQLKRAFAAAKKANVHFYTVLGDIQALNGNLVQEVITDVTGDRERADCSIREFYPPVSIADIGSEFADDEHFIRFKNSVKKRLQG
tara:strand:+ start:694 stop:1002 length:309 start_codon:yes stop_codon:yes gene_type:complete